MPDAELDPCARDPAGLPQINGPDGRPTDYLHTCGSRLYDSQGREVRIIGLNWSGMETGSYAPDGLGTRNWREMLDQVAALGYNTIRVPFTNQTLEPGSQVNHVNYYINPDLEGLTGLEMLDRLVDGARQRGLRVILDRHRSAPDADNSLWYDENVSEERWIADWQMLAARYKGNDTVIGIDLHNEPHGQATWGTDELGTDWRLAAERAGSAVLAVNPYVLILVEGIQYYDGEQYWWGGNLTGVESAPVRLPVPGRLVYSPHDYGPSVSNQGWFSDPDFPNNLPGVWDHRWGHIQRKDIAPVVVGEFGGPSLGEDRDGQWQRALLAYLQENGISAIAWSLTSSWDTGGLLEGHDHTVNATKQEAYQRHLAAAPLVGGGVLPSPPAAEPKVLFRQADSGGQDSDIAFAFRVFNDGGQPLDLTRLEVRYWFNAGDVSPNVPPIDIRLDTAQAELRGAPVEAEIVPANQGGQNHYLRLRFAPDTQPLDRYRATDSIEVRLWGLTRVEQGMADYSYRDNQDGRDRPTEWDRVTLYRDGTLVWGREP